MNFQKFIKSHKKLNQNSKKLVMQTDLKDSHRLQQKRKKEDKENQVRKRKGKWKERKDLNLQ